VPTGTFAVRLAARNSGTFGPYGPLFERGLHVIARRKGYPRRCSHDAS
jgi:hypothetical protein